MPNEIHLNQENCKEKTNFELQHWIDFTGVQKAQPDFDISKCHYFSAIYIKDENKIAIQIVNNCFKGFIVHIFIGGRYIKFELLETNGDQIKNAAFKITKSMTAHCLKHGYRRIQILAAGNDHYIGVAVWGRYGFIPTEPKIIEVINKTITEYIAVHKINPGIINDLYDLHKFPDGYELFEKNLNAAGRSGWYGHFIVELGSRSFEALRDKENLKSKF